MADYQYSAKNNAFFHTVELDSFLDAGWDLDDCLDVTAGQFTEFTRDRTVDGLVRAAGKDGYPVWEEIPPPSQEQIVAAAETERQQRISAANAYINGQQWPSKLALGRMTAAEKTQFNLWLDYLDALAAVDTAAAPDLAWPEKPE